MCLFCHWPISIIAWRLTLQTAHVGEERIWVNASGSSEARWERLLETRSGSCRSIELDEWRRGEGGRGGGTQREVNIQEEPKDGFRSVYPKAQKELWIFSQRCDYSYFRQTKRGSRLGPQQKRPLFPVNRAIFPGVVKEDGRRRFHEELEVREKMTEGVVDVVATFRVARLT